MPLSIWEHEPPTVGLDLVGVDDADKHNLERCYKTETLPNQFLVKNTKKTCVVLDFDNINHPLVGPNLVDIDDVDGYVLESCCNSGNLLNELLVEKHI